MTRNQVLQGILELLEKLSDSELEALYNRLHDEDHILATGGGRFEHQDMVD
ncbi:hypothetical protein [Chitinilyticum litopenaei]|uniref:hypothetical protein n=1 Tax=Chitinilyticum litopenaei TaxID=1121276 RepID=UPI0004285C7D|nr:hypothetical protein [Chitinilyticum litopenaei]